MSREKTSIYGVLVLDEWERWVLTHTMIIDNSTQAVCQRPGVGKDEEVVPLTEALEFYSPKHGYFPESTCFRYLTKLV